MDSPDNRSIEDLKGKLEEKERQIRRLSVLMDMSRAMSSEMNLDRLLLLIMNETREVLEADRCTVFLVDEERGELWSKIALGEENEIRFPISQGLAGYVARTGEVLNIPDAYEDPRFNREVDKRTGYRTKSLLVMPMRNKLGEIIGVFQVLNKKGGGAFTRADEEMLEAIAPHAAIAVENAQLYEEIKSTLDSFIQTLAATIDARDPITAGHSRRVTEYTLAIAEQYGCSEEEMEIYRYAALLHDYGKIGVRESVLFKPGRLTEEEYKQIQMHVVYTREILEKIKFRRDHRSIPYIAAAHQEKVDGSGYPDGLKGDEIPFGGRMMCVADVFDALTSKRHYRDRMPIEKVLSILKSDAGKHFDADMVEKFFRVNLGRILSIIKGDEKVDPGDMRKLERYSLGDFYDILCKENRSPEEDEVVNIFNKYYLSGLPSDYVPLE